MVGAEGVIGWFDTAGQHGGAALPNAVRRGPDQAGPLEPLRKSHTSRTSPLLH
ncbi:MAG: hypothetical protein CBARDCOR_1139 [uncultured Caballeronia sp.]|nr:MAG: hypothetical protein CBARDCOR_1139 [uncultured Caballeronia sp.]